MPAKLILSLDGLVLKELALSKERTTIGRKPDNDIHIDNLAVSGHHAVIVTILNDSFVEDLHSTNGTLVNGRPIEKHFLQNGDVIEIGKYRIKYVNEQAGATSGIYEKTMILKQPAVARSQRPATESPAAPAEAVSAAPAAAASAQPAERLAAPEVATEEGPTAAVQVLTGPAAGRELLLTKALTTLGKPGVQVAVITRRPQGYFITHVEGASFPVVNGKTLEAQPHFLMDHDVVELAGVKLEFFFKR